MDEGQRGAAGGGWEGRLPGGLRLRPFPRPLPKSPARIGAGQACTHSSCSSSPAASDPCWFARGLCSYPALFRASADGKDSSGMLFLYFPAPLSLGFPGSWAGCGLSYVRCHLLRALAVLPLEVVVC